MVFGLFEVGTRVVIGNTVLVSVDGRKDRFNVGGGGVVGSGGRGGSSGNSQESSGKGNLKLEFSH